MSSARRTLLWNLGLLAAYVPAGVAGLKLAFLNSSASPVWPPTGLCLAALLLAGPVVWPAVLAGAFLVNLTTTGFTLVSAAIAAGNTLEALAAWWLVRRFAGGERFTASPRDVAVFVLTAGVLAAAVSASIGTASLCAGGLEAWERFRPVWFTWWLGDFLSVVIVTPLFLAWLRPAGPSLSSGPLELLGIAAFLAIAVSVVFFGLIPSIQNYPVAFLVIPPLLAAGFRLGARGATAACFVMSAAAIKGTLSGFGPFAVGSENTSLLLLQAFTGVISLTSLIVGSVVDERSRVRADLRWFNEELEGRVAARTKELEAFVYTVSHDLRAPLRVIDGFSRIVAGENPGLPAETREKLNLVREAAQKMGRNIDGLLTLYRLGRKAPARERVDLSAMAREVCDVLQKSAPGRRVEVAIAPDLAAYGDRDMLRVVLQNLLENAWKFTSRRERASVRFEAAESGGRAAFAVRDNGAGFDLAYAHQLFKPFRRLHDEKDFPGSGIGLATAKAVIDRHGGEIWPESRVDEGTTIFFTLP